MIELISYYRGLSVCPVGQLTLPTGHRLVSDVSWTDRTNCRDFSFLYKKPGRRGGTARRATSFERRRGKILDS